MYTSCSYYSKAAFIWLKASDYVATIRGQRLFKEIQYIPFCFEFIQTSASIKILLLDMGNNKNVSTMPLRLSHNECL